MSKQILKSIASTLLFVGAVALLGGCGQKAEKSPELAVASPASLGVSEAGLQKIDALVEQAIRSRATPGASILVAKEGKIIYHKAFGKATLATPMQKDTIFLMFSSSKIVPAVAIMKLVDQGKIGLDDPLDKYLPEFKGQTVRVKAASGKEEDDTFVPVKKSATIRQALSMTSGTVGYWDPTFLKYGVDIGEGDPAFDLTENTRRLAKVPLVFEPGTGFSYGPGIDVAGRIVEVVSNRPLAQFLQDEIFKPLGMEDTSFYPPEEKAAKMSVIWLSDGQQLSGKISPYKTKNRTLYSAGVGIYSTTGDYFKLGQMLLNRGTFNGVRILSPESVDAIRSNQIGDLDGVKRFHFYQQGYEKYGLGCFINGKDSFRDEGSVSVLGLGGINFDLNFERNLLVVVQQSVLPPDPAWKVSEEVSRLVYDALKPPKP